MRSFLDVGLLQVLPYELGLRMDWFGIVTRKNHRLPPGAQVVLEVIRTVAARNYGAASLGLPAK